MALRMLFLAFMALSVWTAACAADTVLSKSRRPYQKDMVEGLAPVAGSLDEDTEVLLDLLLALEILEILGPEDVLLGISLLSGGRDYRCALKEFNVVHHSPL